MKGSPYRPLPVLAKAIEEIPNCTWCKHLLEDDEELMCARSQIYDAPWYRMSQHPLCQFEVTQWVRVWRFFGYYKPTYRLKGVSS